MSEKTGIGAFVRLLIAVSFAAQSSCSGPSSTVSSPLPPAPTVRAQACASSSPVSGEVPIRSTYAPGEIGCLCAAAIADARDRYNDVVAIPAARRTFDNTLLAIERIGAEFSDITNPLYFMGQVSPDQRTHDEALECAQQLVTFGVEIGARRDLYLAIKDQTPRPSDADYAAKERLRHLTILGYEQSGMKLPDAELNALTAIQERLADLQRRYSDNLGRESSTVVIARAETDGLGAGFLERQPRTETGDYRIAVNEPNYVEVIQKAKVADVRRRFMLAFTNRGGQPNLALLNEAIALRADVANRLGYRNFADQAIDGRMAKDAATVQAFLEDLRVKLQPRIRQEIAELLAYKQRSEPTSTTLDPWDVSYVSYQIKKNELQVDEDVVREYFPADLVTRGIFDVYSQLLGLRFVEVKNAKTWNPDVKLYEIRDARGASGEQPLIAYFYADLAPRPLKYNHAAAFSLIQGRRLPDGQYNIPVSSIVANFTPAAPGRPVLLRHEEVQTFFHEFGHIMHQTLTRVPFASLSGTSVARDFVEAPSQVLENWVWEPQILNRISGHYSDPTRKLPAPLLEKMLRARDFGKGSFYAKQALYARFDMALHSVSVGERVDAQPLYDRMYLETVGMPTLPGNLFAANFGHLMGGYAAGYYGYLWSDVFASDMFTEFANGRLLDPQLGARYRTEILEKGNLADAGVLLERFLGRPASNAAFLRKLGITAEGTVAP